MLQRWTIGIAGHVDHGKTSLVRALTGIDTDRKPEEKTRGMSIDAGIAELVLPGGRQVALIDVPGHRDFMKNAIRGLSCVDAAVLVVAADDGIMPQTREHLDILSFFKASSGIVVLSKADLVDEETVQIAELEIRDLLDGTFMAEAPIVPFSSVSYFGNEEVLAAMDQALPADSSARKEPFRMWIDQLRSFTGVGTVASGTVLSGRLRQDDPLEILPLQIRTRARSLAAHGSFISEAYTGQRVGINLPKIPLNRLHRGMVLTEPGMIKSSYFLNADMRLPGSVQRPVKNRQKLKIYIGTSVSIATVIIMENERLAPGESGLVQFRLKMPAAAKAGDTYVATLMNVPTVVAGGTILEVPHAKFRPVKARRIISYLKALQHRDLEAFVELFFQHEPHRFLTARELSQTTGFREIDLQAAISSRVSNGKFLYFKGNGAVAKDEYNSIKSKIFAVLKKKIEADPVRKSVSAGEIAGWITENIDERLLFFAAEDLTTEKQVIKLEGGYHLPDALNQFSPQSEEMSQGVVRFAEAAGITPFSADTIWKNSDQRVEKKDIQRVLDFMCTQKKLVRLNDNRFLSLQALEEIKTRVKNAINEKGRITLKDSTEILGYGRWGGAPVFDYLDKDGFTARVGNERVLRRP